MKLSTAIFTCSCLLLSVSSPAWSQEEDQFINTTGTNTFSVLYNMGLKSGDPEYPFYPGLIAQGRDGSLYSTTIQGGTHGLGTVFKISPSGALTVLYNFDGTHGANPYSGLILGTDGNFYGTTYGGGSNNVGTIFKITPAGTLTILHNFTNQSDGAGPWAPPIQASDGNFYGTTVFAGAYGLGAIYKLTPSGVLTTLHSFDGTHGAYPNAPLMQASDGNFYGEASSGGDTNNTVGAIYKISPSGSYTVLYYFDGPHGASPLSQLVQGSDGNLYGTTQQGGSSGDGVIFKITPAGALTVLHNFGSITSDGIRPDSGLVLGSDGNFYGVTSEGGPVNDYGVAFKMTSGGTYSILHDFTSSGTDGIQPNAPMIDHTNGILYGDAYQGGTGNYGTVFSLNEELAPYARLVSNSGLVGSTVQILGQGFSNSTTVSIGGKAATVSSQSGTYLTAVVPSGALSGQAITVTTGTTKLTSNQPFKVLPAIKSFTPTSGAVGASVVISGSGLIQTSKVTIGGVAVTSLTVNSDSQVTVKVPTGAKSGKIVVTTAGGSAISSTSFTVS